MRTIVVTMSDLSRTIPRTPYHAWKATCPAYTGVGVLFFCHHSSVARSYAMAYFRAIGGARMAVLRSKDVEVRRAREYDRYLRKDASGRPHQAIDIESLEDETTPRK